MDLGELEMVHERVEIFGDADRFRAGDALAAARPVEGDGAIAALGEHGQLLLPGVRRTGVRMQQDHRLTRAAGVDDPKLCIRQLDGRTRHLGSFRTWRHNHQRGNKADETCSPFAASAHPARHHGPPPIAFFFRARYRLLLKGSRARSYAPDSDVCSPRTLPLSVLTSHFGGTTEVSGPLPRGVRDIERFQKVLQGLYAGGATSRRDSEGYLLEFGQAPIENTCARP